MQTHLQREWAAHYTHREVGQADVGVDLRPASSSAAPNPRQSGSQPPPSPLRCPRCSRPCSPDDMQLQARSAGPWRLPLCGRCRATEPTEDDGTSLIQLQVGLGECHGSIDAASSAEQAMGSGHGWLPGGDEAAGSGAQWVERPPTDPGREGLREGVPPGGALPPGAPLPPNLQPIAPLENQPSGAMRCSRTMLKAAMRRTK